VLTLPLMHGKKTAIAAAALRLDVLTFAADFELPAVAMAGFHSLTMDAN
jgi:hypothetical protein